MVSWVSIFKCSFSRHGEELESFIFCGIKSQIFVKKKYIVSVQYLTAFAFLTFYSLRILKSYSFVSLSLKASPKVVGDRSCTFLCINVGAGVGGVSN